MFLKIILFFSGTVCLSAERNHEFCHTYGCFESSDTQLFLTLDGDEVYYADFTKELLIWESKIPTTLRPEQAYKYEVKYRATCKEDVQKWKKDKSTIKKKEPPKIFLYPRDEIIKEEGNTLICFINYFFPSSIHIKWTKNNVEVEVEDPFIKCLSNPDGTFYIFSYLDFVPEDGDIYSCSVEHEALTERLTKFWVVEIDESGNGPDVFCGLGLCLGVMGVVAGAFLYVKASQYRGLQTLAG
ncbi:H-2 class II histocompatibility antigen, A-Q alpha chain-like [Oreochromis aureus]|uniref:H-2 class II histocompatibility antigen, A-Q alpha chain-like n=1 Tax=Oreochromis aureus TaxID=47969 RepID=UPI0019546E14|nr:H-2 class II histocompatibility antigen, A-Q alpha chain-like [Oreochromis aureus]